ncbi:Uncharacterised protein [Mycobacteroides abscessus subsp. abscessus]|nr:Uncharacterised protein [Mycobacteroides abscessus subsp. abscessus]
MVPAARGGEHDAVAARRELVNQSRGNQRHVDRADERPARSPFCGGPQSLPQRHQRPLPRLQILDHDGPHIADVLMGGAHHNHRRAA